MNQLKKLIMLVLLTLVIQLKKTEYNTKINEIENYITTDHDHNKSSTAQEFKKLTSEHFAARSTQLNLASKTDIPNITNFVKKTGFNYKFKKLNKRVTSDKKYILKLVLNQMMQKKKLK